MFFRFFYPYSRSGSVSISSISIDLSLSSFIHFYLSISFFLLPVTFPLLLSWKAPRRRRGTSPILLYPGAIVSIPVVQWSTSVPSIQLLLPFHRHRHQLTLLFATHTHSHIFAHLKFFFSKRKAKKSCWSCRPFPESRRWKRWWRRRRRWAAPRSRRRRRPSRPPRHRKSMNMADPKGFDTFLIVDFEKRWIIMSNHTCIGMS